MAVGDQVSNPTRFGKGQSANERELFLDLFGGEVLAAFQETTLMDGKHQIKNLTSGRSWRFPKVWKATSEYHTAGQQLLGNNIETGEISITVDHLRVAHTAIYDLDEMISHFDIRGQFSRELGLELAYGYDKDVLRQTVLAARTTGDGPFPGGTVIEDAALTATGTVDGKAWIDAIIKANEEMYEKDVPESQQRYMAVNKKVFNAIKFAKDANGQYLAIHRDFGEPQAGGIRGRGQFLDIDGVYVYHGTKARLPFGANDTSNNGVYSKYRADYSKTTGVLWTPMATATTKLADVALETERDVRRQEDFMVAKMAVGHGTLRPECAVEFKLPSA